MQTLQDAAKNARKALIIDTIVSIVVTIAIAPLGYFSGFRSTLIFASPVVLNWLFNFVGLHGIKKDSSVLVKIWLAYNAFSIYYTMSVGLLMSYLLNLDLDYHCAGEYGPRPPICDSPIHGFFGMITLIYFSIIYALRVGTMVFGCKLHLPVAASACDKVRAAHPTLMDVFCSTPTLLCRSSSLPWSTQFLLLMIIDLALLVLGAATWMITFVAPGDMNTLMRGLIYTIIFLVLPIVPSIVAIRAAAKGRPLGILLYVIYSLTPVPVAFLLPVYWIATLPFAIIYVPVLCMMLYKGLRLYYLMQVHPVPDEDVFPMI